MQPTNWLGGAKSDVTVNIKGGATNYSDEKFQTHFHSLKC